SATTVLPDPVGAATRTDASSSRAPTASIWNGSRGNGRRDANSEARSESPGRVMGLQSIVSPVTSLNTLRDRVRREIDEGLLPACQFAVAKDGELLAFETFGRATDDSRFAMFSSTKAFV